MVSDSELPSARRRFSDFLVQIFQQLTKTLAKKSFYNLLFLALKILNSDELSRKFKPIPAFLFEANDIGIEKTEHNNLFNICDIRIYQGTFHLVYRSMFAE